MYSKRQKLADKIEQLGSIEHGEIFRKLVSRNISYTHNANGVFVNITNIPADIIDDLTVFVDHYIHNKEMLRQSRRKNMAIELEEETPPPPVEDNDDVTSATGSSSAESHIIRIRTDPPPLRKLNTRFQNLRKKFSRPLNCKTNYVNECTREEIET